MTTMGLAAEAGEEGLFLDALGITAQPLAAVAAAVSKAALDAAGLTPSQVRIVCQRPLYQLQLRVAQASSFLLALTDDEHRSPV